MIRNLNFLDKGLFKGFAYPLIRHVWGIFFSKDYLKLQVLGWRKNSEKMNTCWGYKKIFFVDFPSTESAFSAIFGRRMYDFETTEKAPYIIDCGANTGIAQLFWKERFAEFESVCFEADPELFKILEKNLKAWGIKTRCIKKAITGKEGIVEYTPTQSDSGRVGQHGGSTIQIETTVLSNYINKPVDFLKIDIEGSEYDVLDEIRDHLSLVKNIFVEFHQYSGSEQLWPKYINLLREAGFTLEIKPESASSIFANDRNELIQTINLYGRRL